MSTRIDELPDDDEPTVEEIIPWADADDDLERPTRCRMCSRPLGDHDDDLMLSLICASCDSFDLDPRED